MWPLLYTGHVCAGVKKKKHACAGVDRNCLNLRIIWESFNEPLRSLSQKKLKQLKNYSCLLCPCRMGGVETEYSPGSERLVCRPLLNWYTQQIKSWRYTHNGLFTLLWEQMRLWVFLLWVGEHLMISLQDNTQRTLSRKQAEAAQPFFLFCTTQLKSSHWFLLELIFSLTVTRPFHEMVANAF